MAQADQSKLVENNTLSLLMVTPYDFPVLEVSVTSISLANPLKKISKAIPVYTSPVLIPGTLASQTMSTVVDSIATVPPHFFHQRFLEIITWHNVVSTPTCGHLLDRISSCTTP